MVLLNQSQLLGSIVPDVYISKITLETSGNFSSTEEDNPHIDLPKTLEKKKDLLTGKLINQKVNLNVAKISQNPKGDFSIPLREKLSITLDLVLKEKFDNGLIGTWFKNENFSKYIRLKIIQSTKQDLTKSISKNKNLVLSLDSDFKSYTTTRFKQSSLKSLSSIFKTTNQNSTKKEIDGATQSKILNVKDDIIGDTSIITQQYTEVDKDGTTITSFVFRARFEMDDQFPEHLSYFAFTYLDLEQLAKDYDMKLDSRLLEEPIGKVVSDVVFENGQLVAHSFVYTDANGALWVGPIDEIGDGNFFGIANNLKVPLTRHMVGNSKVQDFRDFNSLSKLKLDFSITNNEITNIKIDSPTPLIKDDRELWSVFSDLYVARDKNGFARFFFSIDFQKLLFLKSVYGKLFAGRTELEKATSKLALLNASILSFKVFRRRIRGSAEIGSEPNYHYLFDDNQIDDLLITTGEKLYQGLEEKNNDRSSIKEIRNIFVPGEDLFGIRYFSGVDKEVSTFTDGYYVYGVEIEIADSSNVFLGTKVEELKIAKKLLNDYLLEASKLDARTTILATNNPHIDFPGETKVDATSIIAGNYNPILNRFSQKFIDEQKVKYTQSKSPWQVAVKTYIDTLKIFTSNSKIPYSKFEKSLFYFTHPATGNPSGIRMLIDLIETLETNIERAIGYEPSTPSATISSSTRSTRMLSKKNPKTIKITKFFNSSVFNSSVPKSVGYNFLDIDDVQDDLSGLKSITGEQYSVRVERETNHYFVLDENINPNIDIKLRDQNYTSGDSIDNTSFSYLTPAKISFGENFKVKRLGSSPTPLLDSALLTDLDLSIKSYNTNPSSFVEETNRITAGENKHSNNIIERVYGLASKLNITPELSINKNNVSLSDLADNRFNSREENIDPIVDDKSICDNPSNEENKPKATAQINPTPVLLDLLQRIDSTPSNKSLSLRSKTTSGDKSFSIDLFDLESSTSAINKVFYNENLHKSDAFFQGASHNTAPAEALAKLPNQIKSLYLSRTSPNVVRKNVFLKKTDPTKTLETRSEFRLDYQMINVVQVFTGYEKASSGELMLKIPKWEPLTVSLYNKSVGDNMLCRLKSYENNILGITRNKSLELPIYDEYFLLRPLRPAVGTNQPVATPLLPPVSLKPTIVSSPSSGNKKPTMIDERIKKPFSVKEEITTFFNPRVETLNSVLKNVDDVIKKGNVDNVIIKVADEGNVSVSSDFNFEAENSNQMLIRTEYMSNNNVATTTTSTQEETSTSTPPSSLTTSTIGTIGGRSINGKL